MDFAACMQYYWNALGKGGRVEERVHGRAGTYACGENGEG